ncbi:MAG TPA: ribose-5-phosphate isomerase RpiA [Polyangiaceae bacterium]|nr:ribose-5-phosphate isomerase RpiA [Polyangiaceae bacterium]
MTVDEAKKEAARAALTELPPSGVVGLGSGSTAKLFIAEVGALVRSGSPFRGVPTSEGSRAQALDLGIPLLGDEGPWDIAVTVDGADEVDANLNLIKGGGAAHTREKIVNFATRKNVIIVDESKLSTLLGEKWPVPVEVLRFADKATARALARIGRAEQRKRTSANGASEPVITDSGNFIYDLFVGPIADPGALDRAIRDVPGVVETGLFVGRADVVIVAGPNGVRRLTRGR